MHLLVNVCMTWPKSSKFGRWALSISTFVPLLKLLTSYIVAVLEEKKNYYGCKAVLTFLAWISCFPLALRVPLSKF